MAKEQSIQHTNYGIQGMANMVGGTVSASSNITEAMGQANMDRQSTTREQQSDMRRNADKAIQDLESQIQDALKSFQSLQEASAGVIGAVARNI